MSVYKDVFIFKAINASRASVVFKRQLLLLPDDVWLLLLLLGCPSALFEADKAECAHPGEERVEGAQVDERQVLRARQIREGAEHGGDEEDPDAHDGPAQRDPAWQTLRGQHIAKDGDLLAVRAQRDHLEQGRDELMNE